VFVHFIKLVNETNSFIGKDKSTSLKFPLIGMVIFSDTSSKPDSRGTFTSGVNASVEHLLDAFQELRLGDSWISEEKDVDITSDVMRTSFE
jgi:hypothetical protein